MKNILVGLLLILFPSLALADGLTPPASDLSVSYLATIFGVVDGVLHGTGSQILGTMLGTFNSAVLVMASVLLTYALFVSILNTSHQGEFLGQKWSSIWVPMRMVSGIALLLPKATGYSFIQVLVMWVVVQGVGAADQVWNVALNYMNRDGTIVEPVQGLAANGTAKSADNTFLVSKAGDVLKSEVCMYALHNGLIRAYQGTQVAVPDFATSLSVTGKGSSGSDTGKMIDYTSDKGGYINFPGDLSGAFAAYKGACGSVSWDFIGKADNDQVANPANLTANDSASIGVRQIMLDLNSLAKNIADRLAPPYPEPIPPVFTLKNDDPLFVSGGLVYPSMDYFAIVKPALRSMNDKAASDLKGFIQQAKETGWMLAGSYYYQMAKLNKSLRGISDLSVIKDQIKPLFKPDYTSSVFGNIDHSILANLKANLPATDGVIDGYILNETKAASGDAPQYNIFSTSMNVDVSGVSDVGQKILGGVSSQLSSYVKTVRESLSDYNQDPILSVIEIGHGMLVLVEAVFSGMLLAISLISIVMTGTAFAVSFFSPAGPVVGYLSIMTIVMVLMPMLTFWMGLNLSYGALLYYYVPLIPFILFMFGVVTWFAVVLEAVIAAPLVALGITHPEGHDFLGKAEQAVMLLASVFLRPMLMVFGFIFGIILSYIAIFLLNQGLAIASLYLEDYSGLMLGLVTQVATGVIYASLVLAVINRSFSMIYEVPNKVLRWIGAPAENTPEESMLQQIRGGVDSSMRELGQSQGQMVSSSASAHKDVTQSMMKGKDEKKGNIALSTESSGTPPPPPVA